MFQSPSLRGSGRFAAALLQRLRNAVASQSPSLRGSGRFVRRSDSCGATLSSLNPLHCGAVVASAWTLVEEEDAAAFQSPSLRGSGHFSVRCAVAAPGAPAVSIPFIAGQWSLLCMAALPAAGGRGVSIPFIAGQWSLLPSLDPERAQRLEFQSPSLRGSGRFTRADVAVITVFMFQSPSLRGSGRFRRRLIRRLNAPRRFQSPSLRGSGRFTPRWTGSPSRSPRFNPLHCGAVVASRQNLMPRRC